VTMGWRLQRLWTGRRARRWVHGVVLSVACVALVVSATLGRLRRSMRELARLEATYATKLALASRTADIESQVLEQDTALVELEARLLTPESIAGFTQSVAVATRAAGCAVASIRPASPRTLPRPDAKAAEASGQGKKAERRAQFLEWPVRLAAVGEYARLRALLMALSSGERCVCVTRMTLKPDGEDRESLRCELELAGYGLGPPREGD